VQTANACSNTIVVETGLQWTQGDMITIAPSSLIAEGTDHAVIVSYSATTGIVNLDRKLTYQHFGQSTSTASTYGIDMRAEVILLSRNIQIIGDTSDNNWGCTVVTLDNFDGM
jgi:hypothetical protein